MAASGVVRLSNDQTNGRSSIEKRSPLIFGIIRTSPASRARKTAQSSETRDGEINFEVHSENSATNLPVLFFHDRYIYCFEMFLETVL